MDEEKADVSVPLPQEASLSQPENREELRRGECKAYVKSIERADKTYIPVYLNNT